MLLQAQAVSPTKLEDALKAQMIYGGRLGTCLVELGLIGEATLAQVLSKQLHVPMVDPKLLSKVAPEVLELVSPALAERYEVIPFALAGRRLDVAFVDPNPQAIDAIQFATGFTVRPHIAAECLIVHLLERCYGVQRPQRYIRLSDDPMFPSLESAPPPKPAPVSQPPASLPNPWLTPGTSISGCVRKFLGCEREAEVLKVVLEFGEQYFHKLAVFSVRQGLFRVSEVNAPESVRAKLQGVAVPSNSGLFRSVIQGGKVHLACLPAEARPLLDAFEESLIEPMFILPLIYGPGAGEEALLLGIVKRETIADAEKRLFSLLAEKATLAMQLVSLKRRLTVLPTGVA